MCTLTWWRDEDGGYEVFFNRDEKKTRARAEVPQAHSDGGVKFLSPRDPDGGGTWMLANEHGVVICLLNRWHEETGGSQNWTSRGRLVWSLAGARSVTEVFAQLEASDLQSLKPFALWAFDSESEFGMDWSEGVLRESTESMPITSSSFRYEEVAAARKAQFVKTVPQGVTALADYQARLGTESTAQTVRMCRPDAQTMSRSRVTVSPDRVRWDYLEEQAELAGEPEETIIFLPRN